jgi:hypothetical protein
MNQFFRSVALLFIPFVLLSCSEERQQPSYEFTISNPADSGSQYPNLYRDSSGTITMSWILNIEEDLNTIQYSTYNQDGWTMAPQTVNISNDYFVNWADFPSVVSVDGEAVAAHWLQKIEGGPYAYNVNVLFPTGQARRWTDPITPHRDETATEHGFVSMEPLSEDRVLAVWLDGRHTADRAHDEYSDPEKAMTLRSAEISSDGTVSRMREIDGMVCDCCSTDLVMLDGEVAVVYRNRTSEEIRDIYISRYNLETGEWSEPEAVHNDGWEINGCPVNGPRIDYNNGKTAVIWYTEGDGSPQVRTATSEDGGQTFSEPVVISEENTIGRADVAVDDNGTVYSSWMSTLNDNGYVMMSRLQPDGSLEDPIQVGITGSSRRSGFPRMSLLNDGLLFAWTQTEPLIRVRTARVSFSQIDQNTLED